MDERNLPQRHGDLGAAVGRNQMETFFSTRPTANRRFGLVDSLSFKLKQTGDAPFRRRHRYGPPGGETDAMATTNGARPNCSKRWVAGSVAGRMALVDRRRYVFQQNSIGEPLRRRLRIGLSPRELEVDAKAEAEGASPPLSSRAEVCSVIVGISLRSLPRMRAGQTKVQRLQYRVSWQPCFEGDAMLHE